jgi:hypothetical protein
MAEVVRIIPVVMRQTTRCAEGLTLFLRSTTVGLFLGLGESPLVSLERISICSELITSSALLDYIGDFDWHYVRIARLSC